MQGKTLLAITTIGATLALGGFFALRLTSAPVQAAGLFPYRDAQAVAQGKTLYADHCASCHGTNLEGELNWRDRDDRGYLPAPPHDPSGHTWHHPDEQLFMITKYGTESLVEGDYKSRMGGFGGNLSDSEILAVLAYIKSTWPPGIIARHNKINGN